MRWQCTSAPQNINKPKANDKLVESNIFYSNEFLTGHFKLLCTSLENFIIFTNNSRFVAILPETRIQTRLFYYYYFPLHTLHNYHCLLNSLFCLFTIIFGLETLLTFYFYVFILRILCVPEMHAQTNFKLRAFIDIKIFVFNCFKASSTAL